MFHQGLCCNYWNSFEDTESGHTPNKACLLLWYHSEVGPSSVVSTMLYLTPPGLFNGTAGRFHLSNHNFNWVEVVGRLAGHKLPFLCPTTSACISNHRHIFSSLLMVVRPQMCRSLWTLVMSAAMALHPRRPSHLAGHVIHGLHPWVLLFSAYRTHF